VGERKVGGRGFWVRLMLFESKQELLTKQGGGVANNVAGVQKKADQKLKGVRNQQRKGKGQVWRRPRGNQKVEERSGSGHKGGKLIEGGRQKRAPYTMECMVR